MRSFPGDEIADFRANTCEEIGFIMQLRWFAWRNDGIPTDENFLFRLGKQLGLTRNRFKKLYESVQNHFVFVQDRIRYRQDEPRRIETEEQTAKLQESGRKGAEIRWANNERRLRFVPKADVAPLENSDGYHLHLHSPVEAINGGEPPPPPPTPSKVEEEVPAPQNESQNLTNEEYQAFVVHCAEVRSPDGQQGLGVPGRKLCQRLRAKFPRMTVAEIIKILPKFDGQTSPGMWDKMTAEHLQLQALNQTIRRDAPRKPTASEEQFQRNLAWARERDQKRKATQ